MARIELIGEQHLNIGKLSENEIRRDFHKYLLQDMWDLFKEYKAREVREDEREEINRRVLYLEERYHSIVGKQFGIMCTLNHGSIDMLLYPLRLDA